MVVIMTRFRFDLVDLEQMERLARLSPGGRIRLMLNARELAVGLIRGRLRRQYPELSLREVNLKLHCGRRFRKSPAGNRHGDEKSDAKYDGYGSGSMISQPRCRA